MKVSNWLFIIISPLWILGISTRLVFNDWFIEYEYSKKDFPEDRWGLDKEVRKKLALLGLKAVLSEEGLKEFSKEKLPDGRKAFRKKEIKHMKDVNRFLKSFFLFTYISFSIWIIGLFITKNKYLYLFYSGLLTVSILITTGIIVMLFYEQAFTIFHNIFFGKYSWRFRYSDTLLRIYPMKFWFDGTVMVVLLSFILSGGLMGSFFLKRFLEKGQ